MKKSKINIKKGLNIMKPVNNQYVRKCILFVLIISIIVMSLTGSILAQGEKTISIIVKGRLIDFPGQQPATINSVTMVPVQLVDEFDQQVTVKSEKDETIVTDGKDILLFKIDSDTMKMNGKNLKMSTKAKVINGCVMVPLKYIAEPFGYETKYTTDSEKTIISLTQIDPIKEQNQKLLVKKMGLTDCLYPDFDSFYSNCFIMRIEEAMARGSGKGIKMLCITSHEIDDQISALRKLAPSADITVNKTLPSDISGYDIVSIYQNLWKEYNLNEIAQKNPNTIFVVTMDGYTEAPYNQPPIDNTAHFNAAKQLSEPNIIRLGREMLGRSSPNNSLYDNVPVADLYVSDQFMMGQALATGVFAILFEEVPNLDRISFRSYIKRHSKTLTELVQPREDFYKRIPRYYQVLDAHLLFESADNDAQDLDTLNLSAYTGKGVKIALIDNDFDLKGIEKKVKAQYVVTKDKKFGYPQAYGKNPTAHGTAMLKALLQTAPDAEIYTILAGPWRGTWGGQDAQDIADALDKAKALKVDIVSMSYGINFNSNENIKKAIRSLTDQGILISWFNSAEVNDNIFRSRGGCIGGDLKKLGPDGIQMYDRFSGNYYNDLIDDLSVSATAPKLAGILAEIREVNPKITGEEIKALLNSTGVKVSDTFLKGYNIMPNVERATRILKKNLSVVSELNQSVPIDLSFARNYDITVNGLKTQNVSSLDLVSTDHFSLRLTTGENIVLQPATQLVSVLLLKDKKGQYYIDSTFNGTIETDEGNISLKVGINPINKLIKKINKININYST